MMLTTEQMQTIIKEEMNGEEPTDKSDMAQKFRESIQGDIELAKRRKWEVRIPSEIEVHS